jgi:hypothetical protein
MGGVGENKKMLNLDSQTLIYFRDGISYNV